MTFPELNIRAACQKNFEEYHRRLSSITRSEMESIIFNYMSKGLFSPTQKSNPSAKISNQGQLATLQGELLL